MPQETIDGLAAALGRVVSGIFILTARNGRRETGMLASWVQQAGFEPPTISVAVKKGRYIADWIAQSGAFALSIIGDDQKWAVAHFGKGFKPEEPAFEGLRIERHATGAPVLADSVAYLDCRLTGQVDAGDHTLFLGEIVDGGLADDDAQPMVHLRRSGLKY